jgi:predicted permease
VKRTFGRSRARLQRRDGLACGNYVRHHPEHPFRLSNKQTGIHESNSHCLSPRHKAAWRLLIASEFTLALVLLIGFGLLLRSFLHVESIPVGIRVDHLLTTGTILNSAKYLNDSARRGALAHDLLSNIQALPAVSSAALTSSLPLTGAEETRIQVEGQSNSPAEVRYISVSPGFFQTLEIPLIAGRALSEHDSAHAAPVVVINQTMARALFPNGNAIGSRIRMEEKPSIWRQVVGIAADVRQRNLEEDSRPVFYRPYVQGLDFEISFAVRVRSDSDMPEVAKALSKAVHEADPQQPWEPVKSMRQVIYDSESLSLRRPIVRLLGGFGVLALVLAAAGLFAVLSHSVAERTREIGIRMAVGARQSQILRQIMLETLSSILPGALVGALSAYSLSQLLPSGHIGWSGSGVFRYGLTRADAITYAGVFFALLFVSLAATFVPALHAIQVDPSVALREE